MSGNVALLLLSTVITTGHQPVVGDLQTWYRPAVDDLYNCAQMAMQLNDLQLIVQAKGITPGKSIEYRCEIVSAEQSDYPDAMPEQAEKTSATYRPTLETFTF